MPKQTRWQLKRDLEQATGNLDQASEYVLRVATRFKGVHDDYYKALETVWLSVQTVITTINDIKDLI